MRWGPRTLDVDVLAVGDETSADPGLLLPHPRAHERAFVLVPWAEVDPDASIPGAGRVADLAAALDAGSEQVRRRDDVTLVVAAVTATRVRLLLVIALVAAVVGWARHPAGRRLRRPQPAGAVDRAGGDGSAALALVLWARGTRARLARRPGTRPIEPLVAARTAALAMAGSRTGAAVAGFYLGVALALSGVVVGGLRA